MATTRASSTLPLTPRYLIFPSLQSCHPSHRRPKPSSAAASISLISEWLGDQAVHQGVRSPPDHSGRSNTSSGGRSRRLTPSGLAAPAAWRVREGARKKKALTWPSEPRFASTPPVGDTRPCHKTYYLKGIFCFLIHGPVCRNILQIGPWTSLGYNFLLETLIEPPPREKLFRRFPPRSFCTTPRSILHPQASHNHHLHDSHAVVLVFNLNFK
ncbi:uncharacterized protein [Triticum aestivum]|uniref:uncharacterized protein n=1 Tax=Triticum aestivum TaxID=4565 RepID=UPI001D002058|nr:uncharacterized protein LOC123074980 [Triticum aestivum]